MMTLTPAQYVPEGKSHNTRVPGFLPGVGYVYDTERIDNACP